MRKNITSIVRRIIKLLHSKLALSGLLLVALGVAVGAFALANPKPATSVAPKPATLQHTPKLAASDQTDQVPATETASAAAPAPTPAPVQKPVAPTTTKKVSTPAPVAAPAPKPIPARITINPTAYNTPDYNRGLFFTTTNFRSGSYAVYARKVVGANTKEVFSTANMTINPAYGPAYTSESGSSLIPEDILMGSSDGDQFEVVICENVAGSCGLRSNALRVVLHHEPGYETPGTFKYEFRR